MSLRKGQILQTEYGNKYFKTIFYKKYIKIIKNNVILQYDIKEYDMIKTYMINRNILYLIIDKVCNKYLSLEEEINFLKKFNQIYPDILREYILYKKMKNDIVNYYISNIQDIIQQKKYSDYVANEIRSRRNSIINDDYRNYSINRNYNMDRQARQDRQDRQDIQYGRYRQYRRF